MRGSATAGIGLAALALLLLPGLASAAPLWSSTLSQPVSPGLGLQDGLLLAGLVEATSSGGAPYALVIVHEADLGGPATVRVCPDRAGEPDPDCVPTPATVIPGATLHVLRGGLAVRPLQASGARLATGAGPALLGGSEVVLNHVAPGPALFAASEATIAADGSGFLLRPLGPDATIEIRSAQGTRTLHGATLTLRVTDADGLHLRGEGAILGLREDDPVTLVRADAAAPGGDGLDAKRLLELQRLVLPQGHAQRVADAVGAFGPFHEVPALLDGVVAAHANLTLEGEPQEGFRLLRVESATLHLASGGRWTGTARAAYLVEDDVLAARPGARVDPPIVVPLLLGALALAGRLLSAREAATPARRRLAWLVRAGGFVALALLADLLAARLLGLHPLVGTGDLDARSRIQLALLALGMALAAFVMVGLSVQSLARTAFATRERPDAALAPAMLGLAAAAVMLLVGHAPLLSLVARLVRL